MRYWLLVSEWRVYNVFLTFMSVCTIWRQAEALGKEIAAIKVRTTQKKWPPPLPADVVSGVTGMQEFECPVFLTPMTEPAILEGYTCEREALTDMQKNKTKNPLTGHAFSEQQVCPNWAIRYAMENEAKRRKLLAQAL